MKRIFTGNRKAISCSIILVFCLVFFVINVPFTNSIMTADAAFNIDISEWKPAKGVPYKSVTTEYSHRVSDGILTVSSINGTMEIIQIEFDLTGISDSDKEKLNSFYIKMKSPQGGTYYLKTLTPHGGSTPWTTLSSHTGTMPAGEWVVWKISMPYGATTHHYFMSNPTIKLMLNYSAGSDVSFQFEHFCLINENECVEHTFGEWATVREPLCSEMGLRRRACLECDQNENENIPTLAHTWWSTIKSEPSCTNTGEQYHLCVGCNKKESTSTIPPLGHKWGGDITNNNQVYHVCERCFTVEYADGTIVDSLPIQTEKNPLLLVMSAVAGVLLLALIAVIPLKLKRKSKYGGG